MLKNSAFVNNQFLIYSQKTGFANKYAGFGGGFQLKFYLLTVCACLSLNDDDLVSGLV